jgi:PD-(D/E)XK nuclease superfamily
MTYNPKYDISISKLKRFKYCPKEYRENPPFSPKSKAAVDRGIAIHAELAYGIVRTEFKDLANQVPSINNQGWLDWTIAVEIEMLWEHQGVIHGGTADVLAVSEDGLSVCLWDWKTGKSGADSLQLDHYLWVASKLYPEAINFASYMVYLDRNKIEPYNTSLEDLANYEQLYFAVLADLKEAETFDIWPARSSYRCRMCTLKEGCAEYQAYASKVRS